MDLNGALQYSTTPRISIPKKTKIVEWNPMGGFNSNFGSSDIVRFNISTQDFWDPYSAYLEVTVNVAQNSDLDDTAFMKGKILQIDGSAKNVFNQLIVYENSQELERIQHLDILQTILQDVCYDTGTRFNKDYEGLGGVFTSSFTNNLKTSVNTGMVDGTTKGKVFNWTPTTDFNWFQGDPSTESAYFKGDDDTIPTFNKMYTQAYSQTSFSPFLNPQNQCYGENYNLEMANDFALNTDAKCLPEFVGPSNPYPPAFCQNGGEPFFSKTLNQRHLQNGFLKCSKVVEQTFFIPLMSGIFGALVHPSNYKLIPMKYFKDLVFEFQFNPHFLFSSWSTKNKEARNYQVKNLVLHATLTEIRDQGILDRIDAEYQNGIRIPYQSWYLGPLYPITQGVIPPTVQINLGFESLRNVLFCFIPNDYTNNAACRKQYRLSMGLTTLQIKIGTEYYPQLRIEGNGGNNIGTVNNYQFLRYLYKAFNKHLDPGACSINPHNFAVNCRGFDINNTVTNSIQNNNKQVGFYEENRVIGKSVYAVPLDSINYTNEILGGVNTTLAKPFEIHLSYDSSKVYPNPVTMYTFCQYDGLLEISPSGISTVGKS